MYYFYGTEGESAKKMMNNTEMSILYAKKYGAKILEHKIDDFRQVFPNNLPASTQFNP